MGLLPAHPTSPHAAPATNDPPLFASVRPAGAPPRAYGFALGAVAAATVLGFVADRLMPHANLSLVFLAGVLLVAARKGLGPALVACVLSFLAYNFLFTPPYYTFKVDDDRDVATLLFFLLVAGVTGHLAARIHREMALKEASLARVSNLYGFGRRMSRAADTAQVLDALAEHLASSLEVPVAVLLPDGDGRPTPRARAGRPAGLPDLAPDLSWPDACRAPFARGGWTLLGLCTDRGPAGLVALGLPELEGERLELARSLCGQAALALDRTLLAGDLERAHLVSETERLRSALLSSVSHDLRTPLATIVGSATSLQEYGEGFRPEDRRELLATVVDEARRLDRYIQNLLDMTRLGQGELRLRRDWVDLNDLLAGALERLRPPPDGPRCVVRVEPDLPLLWVQGVLLEQALVNLLDNALRFSPPGGVVDLTACRDGDTLEIRVCDRGPGIPEAERERVFAMFYPGRQADRGGRQGTGLGLAICRGIVTAHGGSVTAHGREDGTGTCMRLRLPLTRPPGDGEPSP